MEVRPIASPSSAVQYLLKRGNTPRRSFNLRVFTGGGSWRLVVASAKKKDKPDTHISIPRSDEATGPFPEAVLLKKKVVKPDGRFEPEFADAEEEKVYHFLQLQLESALKLERMRHYEAVYLIHEDRVNEVDVVISKVQDFIKEKKGRIWRVNNWGLRRLCYKIKKASNANYILMNFEMDAKWTNDFKSMLDKDERVIRHMVIKRDKAITQDCPPPPEYHSLRAAQGMAEDYYDDDEEEQEVDDDDDDYGEDDDKEKENQNQDGIEDEYDDNEEEEEEDDDNDEDDKDNEMENQYQDGIEDDGFVEVDRDSAYACDNNFAIDDESSCARKPGDGKRVVY